MGDEVRSMWIKQDLYAMVPFINDMSEDQFTGNYYKESQECYYYETNIILLSFILISN